MILRLIGVLAVMWGGGFGLFLATMPGPAPVAGAKTDAIVVLTGSSGRITRGLALLQDHAAKRMLISGVAPQVRPSELAHEYDVSARLFTCCIDLFSQSFKRGIHGGSPRTIHSTDSFSLRIIE